MMEPSEGNLEGISEKTEDNGAKERRVEGELGRRGWTFQLQYFTSILKTSQSARNQTDLLRC